MNATDGYRTALLAYLDADTRAHAPGVGDNDLCHSEADAAWFRYVELLPGTANEFVEHTLIATLLLEDCSSIKSRAVLEGAMPWVSPEVEAWARMRMGA